MDTKKNEHARLREGEETNKNKKTVGESEHSRNIGRSTPGGSNKQDLSEPRRSNIDDDIVPPGRGSRITRDLERQGRSLLN